MAEHSEQAAAEQLLNEEAKTGSGIASLTLGRSDNLTVVLVVMQAGARLQEHQAPGPVTLRPIFGRVRSLTPAEWDSRGDNMRRVPTPAHRKFSATAASLWWLAWGDTGF